MNVLRPINTAQALTVRSRPHDLTDYLFIIYGQLQSVTAYVVPLAYADGVLSGNITAALSELNNEKTNYRIFSVDGENASISQILADGGDSYTSSEWNTLFLELVADDAIEAELHRGVALITSQTDLDKFNTYA